MVNSSLYRTSISKKCNKLLDFLKIKNLIDNTIITKTVEEEAKNALKGQ